MALTREPNRRLQETIAETGWTYDALASAIRRIAAENGETLRTNKSAVAHWIDGARPSGQTGQYIAEALSRRMGRPVSLAEIGIATAEDPLATDIDPVLAATDLGRADVESRRFLAIAVFTTAGVAMPLGYDHEQIGRAHV